MDPLELTYIAGESTGSYNYFGKYWTVSTKAKSISIS